MAQPTISILGCGWLGLPLGEQLVRAGYRVQGSTTTPEKQEALAAVGIEPFVITLEPALTGPRAASFFEADVLVLNVPPPRGRDDVVAFHGAQVDAVRRAAAAGTIQWILFASSTGVYPQREGTVTEDDAPDDLEQLTRASARAVRQAERQLQADDRFDTTIVRLAGLYGGDRHPGRFLAGRTEVPRGEAPVNLIHRDDAVGILQALLAQDVRNTIFNACADAHPTRRALYRRAARQLGLPPPTFSEDGGTGKVVSSDRVKRVLDYRFIHPDPTAGFEA